jgi:DNA-binding transcriptional ArsR family regulator
MALPKLSALTKTEDVDELFSQAKAAADLLKALSHETRLLILCLLSEREMSVSEIEEVVQLPQSNVSQQLARLRQDKLVVARREGRVIYYQIANNDVETVVSSLYDIFCKDVRQ